MHPVRTNGSNFVYRGPTPDVNDAWVERHRDEHAVYLTWQPSDEDRMALLGGATIRLGIYGMEPIPVLSLEVSEQQALSPAGAALRDRALREIAGSPREDSPRAPGWWEVSGDVLHALEAEQALDPSAGVPTLLGRPLLETVGNDLMVFAVGPDQAARA